MRVHHPSAGSGSGSAPAVLVSRRPRYGGPLVGTLRQGAAFDGRFSSGFGCYPMESVFFVPLDMKSLVSKNNLKLDVIVHSILASAGNGFQCGTTFIRAEMAVIRGQVETKSVPARLGRDAAASLPPFHYLRLLFISATVGPGRAVPPVC